jgi:presenilin-like A22 family membrane protease
MKLKYYFVLIMVKKTFIFLSICHDNQSISDDLMIFSLTILSRSIMFWFVSLFIQDFFDIDLFIEKCECFSFTDLLKPNHMRVAF